MIWRAIIVAGWLGLAGSAAAQTPPASPGHPGWTHTDAGCYVWNPNPQPHETATWNGACANGRVTGDGEVVWRSTKLSGTARGSFLDGKQNGQGVYVWASGDRYEGDFRDG